METNQKQQDDFFISEGGIFHHTLGKIRIGQNKLRQVIFFLCITWIPLVIITSLEGTLYQGGLQSFFGDIVIQVRLLLALPMLLLIGTGIDKTVNKVSQYFSRSLMSSPNQQIVFSKLLSSTKTLSSSTIVEILLVIIVVGINLGYKGGILSTLPIGSESWMLHMQNGEQVLSFAGKWADFISIPVYQFLMIRWIWRYVAWCVFLFRLSRTNMNLLATHPDKAGGLGIIVLAQKYFSLIFVAVSTVISSQLISELLVEPGSFSSIRSDGLAYLFLCLFLLLLPMFFFTTKLVKTQEEGLMKLSMLGTNLSNKFEEEWINDKPVENKTKEAIVSTSDLQDYNTIFVSLEELHLVPFSLREVISIAMLLFLPYIPILFIHFSIVELMQKLFGLLI